MSDPSEPPAQGAVPITQLNLGDLPEAERFAVWKESISVLFDVRLAPEVDGQSFTTRLTTCHLGSLLLANTVSPGQSFKRAAPLIARDGLDHFLLQVFRRGGHAAQWGRHRSEARPGDVMLLDLAQPLETRTNDFDNLTLVIPRHLLCRYLPAPEKLHGRVLPRESHLARLLNEHLHALWRALPDVSMREANALAEGVAGMAAAYFGQIAMPGEASEIDAALALTIRRYVAGHLAHPSLSPELLMARFRISRTQLYRLFEPFGGVARYIQTQRLAWGRAELTRPASRQQRIADIAKLAGFADEAHFSRAFRQAFGLSPRDWRAGTRLALPSAPDAAAPVDRRYEEWLRNLG